MYAKDYKPKQGEWNFLIIPAFEYNVRISRFPSEPGLDRNVFEQKIIETFKFENAPESKGYKLLTNVFEFPKEYQEAINAVIDKLKSEEDNPADYYVKIKEAEEYSANTIIISLIHKNTFEQNDPNKIIAGNPSGKDRNIYYNLDVKIITKDLSTR